MRLVSISDPEDSRLADYRIVSDGELIKRRGLFVAEGRLVVQRLIEDQRAVVRSLLLSEVAAQSLAHALVQLPAGTPVYVCERSAFPAITGFNVHRGCLALAERLPDVGLDSLAASRAIVVLENVGNADNLGGVFRNAAAFGAGGVVLSPACCDPLYRKAIRTSMGATLRVPFARAEAWPAALERLRDHGLTIVALTPREPALSLAEFARSSSGARIALLVGAEGEGLSAQAETIADRRVRIPIQADVDSLNLAVATGIALARLSEGAGL